MLVRPPMRRRVFSGEAFSAYINVANPSAIQAINVTLKVRPSIPLFFTVTGANGVGHPRGMSRSSAVWWPVIA